MKKYSFDIEKLQTDIYGYMATNEIDYAEFARRANIHYSQLNRLMCGDSKEPRPTALFQICKLIDTDLKLYFKAVKDVSTKTNL